MSDRHRSLFQAVRGAVLESDGKLDRDTRLAAAEGRALPGEVGELARKVRDEAASIEDADVARALAAGRSEDELFELILASSLGAAEHRLAAARRAMGGR